MIRVASYCRVSTDHEDQTNSFESQKNYFQDYIERHPDWELYAIYADEGITGTSTRRRTQFLRMIEDALDGKFELILTKEISRFSRNILDTIAYTRMLKRAGVGVLFMTENLNSLNPEAEFLLTFMGTIAQEESRRTSVRVKWGQTRRMEQGIVFGPSLLGYHVSGGKITVDPKGAELVRLIFHKYAVEQKGTSIICRELREEGYRTSSGNQNWSAGQIVKILKNEKYVGDLVQKKSFTPDYLTHEKKKNHGEEELVILRNHHEAIIDRKLWNTVQEELVRRNKHRQDTTSSKRYPLSGKIKCGECGSSFVSRIKRKADGSVLQRWGCRKAAAEGRRNMTSHSDEQLGCDVGWLLREKDAESFIKCALARLEYDRDPLIAEVVRTVVGARRANNSDIQDEKKLVTKELVLLEEKKLRAVDACYSGNISEDELAKLRTLYDQRLESLYKRQEMLEFQGEKEQEFAERIRSAAEALLSGKEGSSLLYKALVQEMTVFRTRSVHLRFCCLPQIFVFRETD